VAEIKKEVAKPGVRSWLGVTEVHVEVVEGYWPWRDHLTERVRVEVKGGLLTDVSANHLFLFLLRRGASFNESVGPSVGCGCVGEDIARNLPETLMTNAGRSPGSADLFGQQSRLPELPGHGRCGGHQTIHLLRGTIA
jgi:hypothetical protein